MTEDTIATKWDDVEKPNHYEDHPSGVPCRDISKHLSAFLSQAFQYVWRFDDKGGTQDLEKAVKCINIELTITQPIHLQPSLIIDNLNLVLSSEPDAQKAEALRHIAFANTAPLPERRQHLARVISIIADIVLDETGGIM